MQSIFSIKFLVLLKIMIKFVSKITIKFVITKIKLSISLVLLLYLIFIKNEVCRFAPSGAVEIRAGRLH